MVARPCAARRRAATNPIHIIMTPGQADAELIRVAPYFADNPMVVKVEPCTQ